MAEQTKNTLRIGLLFLLLLLPTNFALCTAIDLEYSLLKKIAYLLVVLVLLLLPATFLKTRTYFIVEGIFNFFLFPIDVVSLYLNRQSTSLPFLENILHTDLNEAGELLTSMWMFCVVVVILWIVYFVLAARVKNFYLFSSTIRNCIWISGAILTIGGIITYTVYGRMRNKDMSACKLILNAVDISFMKLYKIHPYNLYLESIDLIKAHYQQCRLESHIESFSFGYSPRFNSSPTIYVLVIGEAARYDHWGMNGYSRNTTPLLFQQKNLICFDHVYTQANLTSRSLPLILTRATAECPNIAYQEKSILEAFQEAGYESGYISKQIPSSLSKRIMKQSTYSYSYPKPIDVDGNYDEDLVSKLHEYITDTLQFFTLHTLGCHFRYEQRYPASFEKYTPVMGHSFSYAMIDKSNKEKFINAYDNAVFYTDFFLNKLIESIDSLSRPAAVIYISDHGESLWDDERQLSLHGSYPIAECEYHVPFFVWYSDEYATLYPDKIRAMKSNITKSISSDAVFYSLLDLAGIDDTESLRSICSTSLQSMDSIWIQTGSGEAKKISIHSLKQEYETLH